MTKLEELKATAEAAEAAYNTVWTVYDAAWDATYAASADATKAWAAYEAELKKQEEDKT